ncbi:MAG: hypothetical protein HOV80_27490 [Polyangiaceae bacterium]|nr:hypothetical protein [Polyangiaceae bacterium]
MFVFAKRAAVVAALSFAGAFTAFAANPTEAEACGVSPVEAVAMQAVEKAMPGVIVRDAFTTKTDGQRATVRILGGRDGKNVDLVAKLVNGESGWRLVSLRRTLSRKLKSLKA